MARRNYEKDDESFPADAYKVDRHDGVAWHILGWETEPDGDTEWSWVEPRNGRVVCRMVGDDSDFSFDPSEVHPLERAEYCAECGQIGCCGDGYSREEES